MEGRILEHTLVCSFYYVKIFLGDMMKQITNQQFKQVYQLFEKSFIPAELRPYELLYSLFLKGELKIYIQEQKTDIVGAMIVWELNDYIYLENFAVCENLRGQGIGGTLLEELKKIYPHHSIVLEVEEAKDEISQRRIQFYQRHQWIFNPYGYIQPQLRKNVENVYLYLMTYPHAINQQQFIQIKEELFHKVYNRGTNQ